MRNTFIKTISQIAENDPRVMILSGDLGFKLFDDFIEKFPERFLNMGVCEANMVGVAAGLALDGKIPFTYSIVPFATIRCLEQIRNDICNMNLPVTVVGVGGGFAYGVNGATHHGIDDIGAMRSLPGMTVVAPSDPLEVRQLLPEIIKAGKPTYLRLERTGEPDIIEGLDEHASLGVPRVISPGTRLAIIGCGSIVSEALMAAGLIKEEFGVDPLVISMHTIKPNEGLLEFLGQYNIDHIITVEEHGMAGGLGESIAGRLISKCEISVQPLTTPDKFLHMAGSQEYMRKLTGIDAGAIVAKAAEILRGI